MEEEEYLSMKLYIVTADDIEDHYPIAVFDTKDAAEAMISRMKSEKKEAYAKMSRNRAERDNVPDKFVHDFVWEDRMFYSDVVELELNKNEDV